MTVEFSNNGMEMSCDNCPSQDEFEGSWYECIEQAKHDEWIIRKKVTKDGDEWFHFCCEECDDEFEEKR